MSKTVSVDVEIESSAQRLWEMVSDVTRMGDWSPENESAKWLGGATGPKPGAKFRGTNRIGAKKWNTVATIIDADVGRALSFRVAAMGFKVAEWRYTFDATPTGCRVEETWIDQRGRIVKALGKSVTGVDDRASHNRDGMQQTLERLKAAAESSSAAS